MGLLQLLLDAWLGTTGFALGRRAGVFATPKLERVPHDVARDMLMRYLRFGETSLDNILAARHALERRVPPGGGGALASQGTRLAQRLGTEAKSAASRGAAVAERLLRRLRRRPR
mmetsp:Transcript_23003/g.72227  ORF Transcript_23003/g.72227 Transcript_23003/m.72227 type:complete len:115 (+) Transcript_23003:74-418(+)